MPYIAQVHHIHFPHGQDGRTDAFVGWVAVHGGLSNWQPDGSLYVGPWSERVLREALRRVGLTDYSLERAEERSPLGSLDPVERDPKV